MQAKHRNLKDREFDGWTVIEFAGKDERYNRFWFCRCRCGVESKVRETVLLGKGSHCCRSCENRRRWAQRRQRQASRPAGLDGVQEEKTSYTPTPEEIRAACLQIRAQNGHAIVSDLR